MGKRKRRSEQVKAYTLDDLEQLDGPTAERRIRGEWVQHKSKDRTERYERDVRAHPIDALEWAGIVTADQAQAGRDYEALSARCRLVSQGRSCLDISPVGYGDGDHDDPRAWASYRGLVRSLGMIREALIRRMVAGDRVRQAEYPTLRDALDVCATHFRK